MLQIVLVMLVGAGLVLMFPERRAARQSAFASGFRGKLAILGKAATLRRHGFAPLASGCRCQMGVRRETSFLSRHALASLCGDCALLALDHRGKTPVAFW